MDGDDDDYKVLKGEITENKECQCNKSFTPGIYNTVYLDVCPKLKKATTMNPTTA